MSNPSATNFLHLCHGCAHNGPCVVRLASTGFRSFCITDCSCYDQSADGKDRRRPPCPSCQAWGYHDEAGNPAGFSSWTKPCSRCGGTGKLLYTDPEFPKEGA